MNFGNTLEEKYVKISAINRLLKKYGKIFSVVFGLCGLGMIILVLSSKASFFLLISSVLSAVLSFFIGKHIAGRIYGWTWIAFCERFNPKGLLKSLSNAAHNSAIDGYVFGGTSGAKAASAGVLIVFVFLVWIFMIKGTIYTIKYWNLPQREMKLKKQIENKYGKDCELIIE